MDPRELPKFADDENLDPDFAQKLDEALGLCITSIGFGPGLYYDEDDQQRPLVWLEDPIEALAPLSEGGGGGGCEDVFSEINLAVDSDADGATWGASITGDTVPAAVANDCNDTFTISVGNGLTADGSVQNDDVRIKMEPGTQRGQIIYWDDTEAEWRLLDPPDPESGKNHYLAIDANNDLFWDDETDCQ